MKTRTLAGGDLQRGASAPARSGPQGVRPLADAAALHRLQRQAGNAAVQHLLARATAVAAITPTPTGARIQRVPRDQFPGEPPKSYKESYDLYWEAARKGQAEFGRLAPMPDASATPPELKAIPLTTKAFEARYETSRDRLSEHLWRVQSWIRQAPVGSAQGADSASETKESTKQTPSKPLTTVLYDNEFDLATDTVTAHLNLRNDDATVDERKAIVAGLEAEKKTQEEIHARAVKGLGAGKGALNNSEVLWNQHLMVLREARKTTDDTGAGDVSRVIRKNVTNGDTRRIVSLLHDNPRDKPPGKKQQTWTWADGEDFYALLHAPNVRPAAFLARDHPSNDRFISEITTTRAAEEDLEKGEEREPGNRPETRFRYTRSGRFQMLPEIDIKMQKGRPDPQPVNVVTKEAHEKLPKPKVVPIEEEVFEDKPGTEAKLPAQDQPQQSPAQQATQPAPRPAARWRTIFARSDS